MITHAIFLFFSALLVIASLAVVMSRNPVRAALFLVLAFVTAAPLWLIAEAEFLALVLIFVYVGAVMTLFLFVVMMLDLREDTVKKAGWVRYWPFGLIVMGTMVGIILYVLKMTYLPAVAPEVIHHTSSYSNTTEIGKLLYTDYIYAFELAAVLLLVAIVAAISLAFRGARHRKGQVISEQVAVRKEDRVRMVNMRSEKKA